MIARHKAGVRERLRDLATQAGAKEPVELAERLFVVLEGAYVTGALEGDRGVLDRSARSSSNWWRRRSGIVREAGERPGAGWVTLRLWALLRGAGFCLCWCCSGVGFFGREGRFGILAAYDLCWSENPGGRICDLARGRRWGGSPHLRRDWPVFVLLAAFNVVFFFGFQTLAILYLPSGTAAVLEYLQPMLVGLLAWVILGESLSLAKIVGLTLGFGHSGGERGSVLGNVSVAGVAFGAGSALSWALGTVLFKRYEARVSTMWAVAIPFVIGGIVLTLLASPQKTGRRCPPRERSSRALLRVARRDSAGVVDLVRPDPGGGGEPRRGLRFLCALVSIVIGAVFLDERPTLSLLIGAALIVTGIYTVNRSPTGKDKYVD